MMDRSARDRWTKVRTTLGNKESTELLDLRCAAAHGDDGALMKIAETLSNLPQDQLSAAVQLLHPK